MNPQDTQMNNPQLSPEDAKAALGLTTRLQEQLLMPQASQEASIEPQNAPEQEETPETDIDTKMTEMEDRLSKQIDDLKKELKKDPDDEVESIKKELQAILDENED